MIINKRWWISTLSILAIACAGMVAFRHAFWNLDALHDTARIAAALTQTPGDPLPSMDAAFRMLKASAVGRDPFEPRHLALAPPVLDTLHLSAIWTENGDTLVLVNDRILRPGDAVGRVKIESASQDGVWVVHWRGRDFISLGGTFTLSTPATQDRAGATL